MKVGTAPAGGASEQSEMGGSVVGGFKNLEVSNGTSVDSGFKDDDAAKFVRLLERSNACASLLNEPPIFSRRDGGSQSPWLILGFSLRTEGRGCSFGHYSFIQAFFMTALKSAGWHA